MLTTCLLLAALSPADSRSSGPADMGERLRPTPTLRELCIQAPVVVLARPVDPITPTQFTVLAVLRGKEVKVGQRLAPAGLVEKKMQSFDQVDPNTGKPWPRRIDQALLFLQPGKSTEKKPFAVMPAGYRLCTDDGRVLVPVEILAERISTERLHHGPQVAEKVTWAALLVRVRTDLAAVDRLHVQG